MIRKYYQQATGCINVINKLKVKVSNGSLKLKNYGIKREQFQENRMFRTNASQFYKELNEKDKEEKISPDPGEATKFWGDIWSVPSTHNHDARWFRRVKQELADIEKKEGCYDHG